VSFAEVRRRSAEILENRSAQEEALALFESLPKQRLERRLDFETSWLVVWNMFYFYIY